MSDPRPELSPTEAEAFAATLRMYPHTPISDARQWAKLIADLAANKERADHYEQRVKALNQTIEATERDLAGCVVLRPEEAEELLQVRRQLVEALQGCQLGIKVLLNVANSAGLTEGAEASIRLLDEIDRALRNAGVRYGG